MPVPSLAIGGHLPLTRVQAPLKRPRGHTGGLEAVALDGRRGGIGRGSMPAFSAHAPADDDEPVSGSEDPSELTEAEFAFLDYLLKKALESWTRET